MRRLAIALAGALLVAGCGSSGTPAPIASSHSPSPSSAATKSAAPATLAPTATIDASVTPTPAASPSAAPATTYKVVKNDTFTKIAKKFGITVAVLQAANPKVNPNKLTIGTVLKIPAH